MQDVLPGMVSTVVFHGECYVGEQDGHVRALVRATTPDELLGDNSTPPRSSVLRMAEPRLGPVQMTSVVD